MSYDRYKEWTTMVCPNDETKRRVVLYSIYDIQEYSDAIKNGEDYTGEELHWGSKAMEPEVAEHMVEYLKQYRQDLVTRK
jgi:hypothetical protein